MLNRKTLLTFSLLLSFTLCSSNLFAQYPGMGAVRAQTNRQLFNQQMRMMQMQGIRYYGDEELQTFNFQVTFTDSTKRDFVSAIYTDSVTKRNYLLMVDRHYKKADSNRTKKIYPSQTLYIAQTVAQEGSAGDENAPVKYFFGRPSDSCWMFRVKTGAITAYSNMCYEWDDKYSPSIVVAIQLNDGPLEKYNEQNLKAMISNDSEAMTYFDKKKYFKAVDKFNNDAEKAAKK